MFPEPEQAQRIIGPASPDSKQHIFGPTVSDLKQLKTVLLSQAWIHRNKRIKLNITLYLVPRTFNIRE